MSPETLRTCAHCGSPLPTEETGEYCCRGCAYVAGQLRGTELERFYDLRDRSVEPVSSSALRPLDTDWLEDLLATEEEKHAGDRKPRHLLLDLKGVSCVGCVWVIEKVFTGLGIAGEVRIHPQRGQVEVFWREQPDRVLAFFRKIKELGYTVAPPAGESGQETERIGVRIGTCAALAMNTMLFTLPVYLGMEADFPFAGLFALLSALFASLSFAVGGTWFVVRAWRGLRRGIIAIDLPIALGVSAAYAGSLVGYAAGLEHFLYFDFVAVFIFLMLLGRWVHERALERNRNRVRSQDPSRSTYATPGGERIAASALQPGTELILAPGQILPTDAELGATASLSLESINGEPEPRVFPEGSRAPSGALHAGSQPLPFRALESWDQSLLHRLLETRPDASRNQLMERVLQVYLGAVLLISTLGWLGWGVLGSDWVQGAQVFLSILVVSCPCSLGVAYPLINELAAARLRRFGVYLREASVWSRLAPIRHLVFDKTGTLTLETLRFTDEGVLDRLSPEERSHLRLLVEESLHPVARTVREALLARRVSLPEEDPTFPPPHIAEIPGEGLLLRTADGTEWSLGKAGWRTPEAPDSARENPDNPDPPPAPAPGGSRAVFAREGEALTTLFFTDQVRHGAREELEALRRGGREVTILSGDRAEAVHQLAGDLGLPPEHALGGLRPEEKQEWIRTHAPGSALMVGDGLNDSLAFHEALARATPLLDRGVLEERSDFYFTGTDLRGIRHLFRVFAERRRGLHLVFGFAVAYNLAAIGVCLFGWMNPLLAAVLMPISSLLTLGLAAWTVGARGRDRARPRTAAPETDKEPAPTTCSPCCGCGGGGG